MKNLDPSYFNLTPEQVNAWVIKLPLIRERIFKAMQDEMLSIIDNSLVERHIKQVQYDCVYLLDVLFKFKPRSELQTLLCKLTGDCLDEIMTHVEDRYGGFFNMQRLITTNRVEENSSKIRVSFSVDVLAYFFKLLKKSGGLDGSPTAQLIIAVAKNFITPGIGNRCISPNSLTTKYKQVVQSTAGNVRTLLLKMLKHLDEEFKLV